MTEKQKRKKKAQEERAAKKAAEEAALATQEANGDDGDDNDDDDNAQEVFYGAPDDVAWTDKSAAQIEAEKNANNEPDRSVSSRVFFSSSLSPVYIHAHRQSHLISL